MFCAQLTLKNWLPGSIEDWLVVPLLSQGHPLLKANRDFLGICFFWCFFGGFRIRKTKKSPSVFTSTLPSYWSSCSVFEAILVRAIYIPWIEALPWTWKKVWLVVWLTWIWHFPINIGFLSSSQLTLIFFRGVAQPPTRSGRYLYYNGTWNDFENLHQIWRLLWCSKSFKLPRTGHLPLEVESIYNRIPKWLWFQQEIHPTQDVVFPLFLVSPETNQGIEDLQAISWESTSMTSIGRTKMDRFHTFLNSLASLFFSTRPRKQIAQQSTNADSGQRKMLRWPVLPVAQEWRVWHRRFSPHLDNLEPMHGFLQLQKLCQQHAWPS